MSQLVIIACPMIWSLGSFAPYVEAIARQAEGACSITGGKASLQIRCDDWSLVLDEMSRRESVAEGYASDPDFDPQFRAAAKDLRFFVLDFDNLEVARRLLQEIARDAVQRGESVWFDTDYGWVIHSAKLLKEIDDDPQWDWRRDPIASS